MTSAAVDPIIVALATALAVPVQLHSAHSTEVGREAMRAVDAANGQVVDFEIDGERYLAARYHTRRDAIIILGPFHRPADPSAPTTALDSDSETRARDALGLTAEGLRHASVDSQDRLDLTYQLEVVGRAVIAVTSELEINLVLHRIVDLARELAGAKYAAFGVPGPHGGLRSFITSGMTPEQERRIGNLPVGRGILGLLQNEAKTFRLSDLGAHPQSVGFPPNHPPMKSFLGVPIIVHGVPVGHLYLTEKRFRNEFSDEDVQLIELLARHAAVAIENAHLFESLEGQRQDLQVILDQLPEAVILVETKPDRIVLANPQASKLLGWDIHPPMTVEEFVQRNPRTFEDKLMLPEETSLLRSLWSGEELRHIETELMRPDGNTITTLVNSTPLRSTDGQVTGAIVIFQDISQIKDAEQLKDDFLSLVSHELRTPLTSIQGNALMLMRDREHLDTDSQESMLSDMAAESRRLAALIENMVQLANIRAGRLHMETEPVFVKSLIDNVVQSVRQLAPDRVFNVTVEPNLLAMADRGRLDQVIRNLLHNAVKYSPEASPVDVNARSHDHMVEMAIRDYGAGITEDEFPYVFERFRRGEQMIAKGTPGMGLGLYLARHLIEAHGGRIWIECPADGGTRVLLTVPVVDPEL